MSGEGCRGCDGIMGAGVGIDLGTSYSSVAVCVGGVVRVLANEYGHRMTPSCVAFTDYGRFVGDAARSLRPMNLHNTVFDTKRIFGRRFSDDCVQGDKNRWPFLVVDRDDEPMIQVQYKGTPKHFSAVEISAMIISHLKDIAEKHIGKPVNEAVIACPAHFTDSQRLATKEAGEIAGLKVVRIINEPTAAAFAYALQNPSTVARKIVVFDLGSGTQDVSLLRISDSLFQVKATSGNTHMGGEDFTNRLLDYCVSDFQTKHLSVTTDIRQDPRAMYRLHSACERVKRELSFKTAATVEVTELYMGIDYNTCITRAKFEELITDMFSSNMVSVAKVLERSGVDKSSVDEVVLVGGSSRIPKVQQLLQEFFNGKLLNTSLNPDEAIAYGAAVQAANILSSNSNSTSNSGSNSPLSLKLHDVTPLTLGLEIAGGQMKPVIPRNTPLPCTRWESFSTYTDNQLGVLIQVYEGERAMTKDCNLLGKFNLEGIAPVPKGIPEIVVTFAVDSDGILSVTAEDVSTRNRSNLTITNDKRSESRRQTVQAMLREARRLGDDDMELRGILESKNHLEIYAYTLRASITKGPAAKNIAAGDRAMVERACKRTIEWLGANQNSTKAEYESHKSLLESTVQPVVGRYSLELVVEPTGLLPHDTSSSTACTRKETMLEEVD
ncbi:heat-shock protein 70 [Pelomyxa schiedti]|nr:heat-shock protein 70 [Pelomyxa schiedti]